MDTIDIDTVDAETKDKIVNNQPRIILNQIGKIVWTTNNQKSIHNRKIMSKKPKYERKYPCGFPGCHWIFTRSNHVVRHQRRIHQIGNVSNRANNQSNRASKQSNLKNEIESDSKLIKSIPELYERFIEVVDSVTLISCQLLMCKTCRSLLKKNSTLLQAHVCKQKDIEKFRNIPILNNQLVFRSEPKNRATPIWNEFEEVVEPASNQLLGYARCKRCFEIIKTVDPKGIPACLRKHVPLCPHEFPTSALIKSNRSSTSLSENQQLNNNLNKNSSKNLNRNLDSNLNNNLNNNFNLRNSNSKNSFLVFKKNSSSSISVNSLVNRPPSTSNTTKASPLISSNNNVNNGDVNGSTPNLQQQQQISTINPTNKLSTNSSSSTKIHQLKNEFREQCIEFCFKELISLETIRSPAFKRLCQTLLQLGSLSTTIRPILQMPDTSELQSQLLNQRMQIL